MTVAVTTHPAAASRVRALAIGLGLAVAAAWLHLHSLASAPPRLSGDEVQFATHAYSLATSGHDLGGTRLPLFFRMTDPLIQNNSTIVWFQPMLFYALAATLKVLPLSESSIRTPSALAGALDVVLVFFVGRRLFPRMWQAVAAAVLLATSPAHLIFSRVAADYICSVPWVLAWLLCLFAFLDSGGSWRLFLAGLFLGVGFYSYIAAWVMMPFYVALSWIVLPPGRPRRAACAALCAGFALPLLLFPIWLSGHPTMLTDTLTRYGFINPHRPRLLASAGRFGGYDAVRTRLSVYWDYFNPSYLFLAGGSNPLDSTRRAGVLLVPVAVFLTAGVIELWRHRDTPKGRLLLIGLLSAPFAAVVIGDRYASDRELFLLPFAALTATLGVASLWSRGGVARSAAAVLALCVPLQFVAFYRDYTGAYSERSAGIFDPSDFREIAASVTTIDDRSPIPVVYLGPDLSYAGSRWKFYLLKDHRDDLFDRSRYLDAAPDPAAMPQGAILILSPGDRATGDLLRSGRCAIEKQIVDGSGSTTALVMRVRS